MNQKKLRILGPLLSISIILIVGFFKLNDNSIKEEVGDVVLTKGGTLTKEEYIAINTPVVSEEQTELGGENNFKDGSDSEHPNNTEVINGDKVAVEDDATNITTENGALIIIVDDLGASTNLLTEFLQVDLPLTFGLLPQTGKVSDSKKEILASGKEIILDLPLESSSQSLNGATKGMILTSMNSGDITKSLDNNLENITETGAVMNHLGSTFINNETKLRELINYLDNKDLYFLENETGGKGKAYQLATSLGVASSYTNKILDRDSNPSAIKRELEGAMDEALDGQVVIAIAHYNKNTLSVLKEVEAAIKEKKVPIYGISILFNQDKKE